LEPVTKVEAGFAAVAGAAAVVEAEDDAVLPGEAVDGAVPADVEAEAVDLGAVELEAVDLGAVEPEAVELGAVEPAAVEPVAVELAGAFDDVAAELSEPQPLRAAKKETHTSPAHALSASILKIIVTCPIAA
jgi:hypothetical protein